MSKALLGAADLEERRKDSKKKREKPRTSKMFVKEKKGVTAGWCSEERPGRKEGTKRKGKFFCNLRNEPTLSYNFVAGEGRYLSHQKRAEVRGGVSVWM